MKAQQRFRSEKHNVFTEKTNKIALVPMMIKEHNQFIRQRHMPSEQVKIWYARKKKKLNVTIKKIV